MTGDEQPEMSRGWKAVLALATYVSFAWMLIGFAVAFVGRYFVGGHHEGLRHVWLAITYPMLLISVAVTLYAFIWVILNLTGRRRILWIVGFLLTGTLATCIWWWILVRPLPEPQA